MSSISEEIAALKVAAAEQTAASQALAQEVAGKIAQIDATVEEAQKEFEQFQTASDKRYWNQSVHKVTVGGDRDKFYPVYIPTIARGIITVDISRRYNYSPGSRERITARWLSCNDGWGAYAQVHTLDILSQNKDSSVTSDTGLLAHHRAGAGFMNGLIVWLKGDTLYDISTSAGNIVGVESHDALVTDHVIINQGTKIVVLNAGANASLNGHTEKLDVLTARNTATVPTLNYTRGVN